MFSTVKKHFFLCLFTVFRPRFSFFAQLPQASGAQEEESKKEERARITKASTQHMKESVEECALTIGYK